MVKMVIVDDYLETAESLALIYGAKNHIEIVGVAQNREQLWGILDGQQVDFISLDIQLGEDNGIAICEELHQQHPEIFIVICSVEATLENRRLAEEAGASHFLAKPITLNDASETMQKFHSKTTDVEAQTSRLTKQRLDELLDLL